MCRMGDGERVEEDRGLLGSQVIPRAGSVGGAGADRNGHIPDKNIIPHVREWFCQSTSSSTALRGASSA